MKRKRYSEEQIISILKEHEAGMPAQEVIRKHGIANGTFYRWKEKFSGMEFDIKGLFDVIDHSLLLRAVENVSWSYRTRRQWAGLLITKSARSSAHYSLS